MQGRPFIPSETALFLEGGEGCRAKSRWGNLWPRMEAKEISHGREGHRGSTFAGKGGEAAFALLSPRSARKPLGEPTGRCRAARRSPERGFAPLPSGAEEGKADVRRWHSSRGGGVSAWTLPCSPRHRGAGQATLSAHIPGARFPSAAWPPRTTALNEIL